MPRRPLTILLASALLVGVATLDAREARAAADPEVDTELVRWQWPLDGRITSHFGPRDGRHHDGVDITTRVGRPVHAAGSGRVRMAGTNGGYGLFVEIEHADGHTTRYAHLDALWVRKGQWVEIGAPLGPMGSTGHVTGPHLHFEVYEDGQPVDPAFLAIELMPTDQIEAEELPRPFVSPPCSTMRAVATAGLLPVVQQALSVALSWWQQR